MKRFEWKFAYESRKMVVVDYSVYTRTGVYVLYCIIMCIRTVSGSHLLLNKKCRYILHILLCTLLLFMVRNEFCLTSWNRDSSNMFLYPDSREKKIIRVRAFDRFKNAFFHSLLCDICFDSRLVFIYNNPLLKTFHMLKQSVRFWTRNIHTRIVAGLITPLKLYLLTCNTY